jgi:hypothetical protein
MTIYGMAGCIRLHNVIYEGLLETAEYMAEYQYLYSVAADGAGGITGDIVDTGVAVTKLKAYIDDEALVDKYVSGGSSGLIFSECRYDEDNGYIYLTLTYAYGIEIPFVGKLTKSRVEKIKQKAYVGYMSAGADDEASAYVYVAEYGDVYHTSRSCTHIKLSISQVNEAVLKQNYSGLTACEYCAQNHAKTGVIYVTDQGDRYHFSLSCTGLKRTVSRIKKNEAGNMTACSKCG